MYTRFALRPTVSELDRLRLNSDEEEISEIPGQCNSLPTSFQRDEDSSRSILSGEGLNVLRTLTG
jgi:hypothetical protein